MVSEWSGRLLVLVTEVAGADIPLPPLLTNADISFGPSYIPRERRRRMRFKGFSDATTAGNGIARSQWGVEAEGREE